LDWLPAINDEPQRQLLPTISDLADLKCFNNDGDKVVDLARDQVPML
jgi:hypothetical protein